MEITITKTYDKDDIEDIISVMFQSFNPYFMLDNTTDDWKEVKDSLTNNATIEEITRVMFESGHPIKITDVEDETDYYMTQGTFEHGVKKAIDEGYWDGDVDMADASVGYVILQFALFNEILYD